MVPRKSSIDRRTPTYPRAARPACALLEIQALRRQQGPCPHPDRSPTRCSRPTPMKCSPGPMVRACRRHLTRSLRRCPSARRSVDPHDRAGRGRWPTRRPSSRSTSPTRSPGDQRFCRRLSRPSTRRRSSTFTRSNWSEADADPDRGGPCPVVRPTRHVVVRRVLHALVDVEVIVPRIPVDGFSCKGGPMVPATVTGSPYFCIPINELAAATGHGGGSPLQDPEHRQNIEGIVRFRRPAVPAADRPSAARSRQGGRPRPVERARRPLLGVDDGLLYQVLAAGCRVRQRRHRPRRRAAGRAREEGRQSRPTSRRA